VHASDALDPTKALRLSRLAFSSNHGPLRRSDVLGHGAVLGRAEPPAEGRHPAAAVGDLAAHDGH